jgi:hypothetical protein
MSVIHEVFKKTAINKYFIGLSIISVRVPAFECAARPRGRRGNQDISIRCAKVDVEIDLYSVWAGL